MSYILSNSIMWKEYDTTKWRSFINARKYVHKLKIRSEKEWRVYSKSSKRPYDIPSNPNREYKEKGWISWGDWLGTNSIATQKIEFLPFDEALSYVHKLQLKNQHEWFDYCKSGKKPDNIPQKPHRTYKNEGWQSYGHWLGTGSINLRDIQFLPFKKARKFVRNLNLKNMREWYAYCTSGNRPINIPTNPDKIYSNDGWISFIDWLGNDGRQRDFLPFQKARGFARSLDLKSSQEWNEYSKSGRRPINIPSKPNKIYNDKGWRNWPDWLGYKR